MPKGRPNSVVSRLQLQHEEEALKRVEQEEVKLLQRKLWQLDPMLWLKERFKEDPAHFKWSMMPGYENHVWDGSKDPMYRSWLAIAKGAADGKPNWAGIEAATGTGKTFTLSRIVFWFLDCFEDSLVVTSAPKQAQLTLHLWSEISKAFYKFKRIRPKAALYTLRLVVDDTKAGDEDFDPDNPNLSKSWQAVGFVSGVGSVEESATKAQGFHRKDMLIITEETPGMPDAVMTAFKNTSIAGNNQILAVGNPDSQLDPLHTFCTLKTVHHFRISALDYPNVVLGKELIPGAVTQHSIDRRAVEYGVEAPMYKSRVRGISPEQDTDSLIQRSWILNCVEHELPYDYSYHAVGVDVANSENGDKAALAWGNGNQLMEVHDFSCPNATHLAYNLFMETHELREKHYTNYNTRKLYEFDIMPGMVGVDTVGVGVATFNALLDEGLEPVSLSGGQWEDCIPEELYRDENDIDGSDKDKYRKLYKFQGLRSQMWWELREDLRQGKIKINIDDKDLLSEIIKELITIKVTYRDNFIAVESKDTLKKRLSGKSPNKADAIVYWNWTRKGYRLYGGAMPVVG